MPDINLTITIPDDKVTEARIGILAARPLPEGMTEIELLEQIAKEGIQRVYRKGKYLLSQKVTAIKNLFEVV